MTIDLAMSAAAYHAAPGISSSRLRAFLRSPLAYHEWTPPAETPAMALGTAIHTAVLEPEHCNKRHPVAPACNRRTKVGRAEYEAWIAGLPEGAAPISAAEAAVVSRVKQRLLQEKLLPFSAACLTEASLTGGLAKARFDILIPRGTAYHAWDLKSTADPGRADSLIRSGWWLQAAHYVYVASCHGLEVTHWSWLVVGTTPPYEAQLLHLDSAALEVALEAHAEILLEVLARTEANDWSSRPRTVSLPPWTFPTPPHPHTPTPQHSNHADSPL